MLLFRARVQSTNPAAAAAGLAVQLAHLSGTSGSVDGQHCRPSQMLAFWIRLNLICYVDKKIAIKLSLVGGRAYQLPGAGADQLGAETGLCVLTLMTMLWNCGIE